MVLNFPIANFILDFYCNKKKLAIELDGAMHDSEEAKLYDAEHTKALEEIGIRLIRFRNEEVFESIDQVKTAILVVLQE